MYTILLAEDDPEISTMVRDYLAKDGFQVIQAYDGEEAVKSFHEADSLDLIILDLMLPKRPGMEVLKEIREASVIPILIMSAKDGEVDKALGLGFGADDYITKPFSLIELGARVNAAIRRARQYSQTKLTKEESGSMKLLDLIIDADNFAVTKKGQPIKLTAKEFQILTLFVSSPKRVFTKAQIYQLVWNENYYGDENVINVHMRRLREKIEDDPSHPKYITTIWGIGYRTGEG